MQDVTAPVVPATPVNRFIGAKVRQKIQFMGLDLWINKLSITQVQDMKRMTEEVADPSNPSEEDNLRILIAVVKMGAPDLADIEDFGDFPIDEIAQLANKIMKHSGLSPDQPAKK